MRISWYNAESYFALRKVLLALVAEEVQGEQMTALTLQELLEAGCHFGHQSRRWHPAMSKYIYGVRDGVHVIDLEKTKLGLDAACEFMKKVAAGGGVILYVGTKRQAQKTIRESATRVGMPYMAQRWLAGMLTNYSELYKRMLRLESLKTKRATGELKKYTKKEQLLLDREIIKLEKFFGGVVNLAKKPDALFIVDSHHENVAVREARKMNVPVVAMVDTNADPEGIEYVIPTNDDAEKAIELIVMRITEAIQEGINTKSEILNPK